MKILLEVVNILSASNLYEIEVRNDTHVRVLDTRNGVTVNIITNAHGTKIRVLESDLSVVYHGRKAEEIVSHVVDFFSKSGELSKIEIVVKHIAKSIGKDITVEETIVELYPNEPMPINDTLPPDSSMPEDPILDSGMEVTPEEPPTTKKLKYASFKVVTKCNPNNAQDIVNVHIIEGKHTGIISTVSVRGIIQQTTFADDVPIRKMIELITDSIRELASK